MAGYRFWLQISLAAFLAVTIIQNGWSQPVFPPPANEVAPTCKVYSLAEFGDDPKLCQWIAATIPQMIEPDSWKGRGLSYHAPAKLLAINHTPAVHIQVDAFLTSMRKARPQSTVVPARFDAPGSMQAASPARPKHLFHFIIRHEGDGSIDANTIKQGLGVMPHSINNYSSDPLIRMEQNMIDSEIDSESLRKMHEEWRRGRWMLDQPSNLTPYRIHGGVGPASSSLYTPSQKERPSVPSPSSK